MLSEKYSDHLCTHPKILVTDPGVLAWSVGFEDKGSSCYIERCRRSPFAKCGIKGKLWESKDG